MLGHVGAVSCGRYAGQQRHHLIGLLIDGVEFLAGVVKAGWIEPHHLGPVST